MVATSVNSALRKSGLTGRCRHGGDQSNLIIKAFAVQVMLNLDSSVTRWVLALICAAGFPAHRR
jgi:hypothetical protein